MSNLRDLFLSQNRIENIEDDSFNNFKHLLDLDLSQNNITKIKLKKFEKIFRLNLSHNLLENIDFLFEINLKQLKYLSLNNIKIRNVSYHLFSSFNSLFKLDISFNEYDKSDKSISIKKINRVKLFGLGLKELN
jgi:Leucine-rich repeat (LRR) protein